MTKVDFGAKIKLALYFIVKQFVTNYFSLKNWSYDKTSSFALIVCVVWCVQLLFPALTIFVLPPKGVLFSFVQRLDSLVISEVFSINASWINHFP